jgi:hypothetical protein|tara:strand:- start:20 stop:187 length:168 start_codon:yes stop_codon:yes gene_type:complete
MSTIEKAVEMGARGHAGDVDKAGHLWRPDALTTSWPIGAIEVRAIQKQDVEKNRG